MGSGRVCPGSFSEAKTSKQSSHVLETQRLALQVEKGKDAAEACDERGKDQQVSGEGRRAKNHKVPVAYAAGLTVCYPVMCNTESSNADALSWPGEQSQATYCLWASSNCNSIKGQGHPGGIENIISSVEHTLFP